MKKNMLASLVLFVACSFASHAQQTTTTTTITTTTTQTHPAESYGNTLNIGLGIGYYGYVGHSIGVLHADYEFNVARNFTLAPFITFYSYQDYYYTNQNYYYRETVVPVGVKGSYYFDQLLHAGPRWDFYLAGSLGFAIRKTVWANYYGETVIIDHGTSGMYLDGHIGTEYHLNQKLGLYLDLSTGISTFGLAVHF